MSLPIHRHNSPSTAESSPTSTNRQTLYRALHDFVGQSQTELTLRNGDIIDVIERTENGNLHSLRPLLVFSCVLLKPYAPNI